MLPAMAVVNTSVVQIQKGPVKSKVIEALVIHILHDTITANWGEQLCHSITKQLTFKCLLHICRPCFMGYIVITQQQFW